MVEIDVHDPEVVVIGGGPAGLVAAATLARYGVRSLLVERRAMPSPVPKATLASLRTMELLRAWGLEEPVRAGGNDVLFRMAVTSTLADLGPHESIDVGVPSVEQAGVLSPTAPACVPQDHLESVLFDHVRALPEVEVRTGASATVEHLSAGGARVRVDGLGGGTSVVDVPYVIAADGAHTLTRRALGIGSVSTGSLYEGITFVVRAPLWELVGPHRHLLYAITDPRGAGTLLPAGAGDRWVYGREWDPATERRSDYPHDRVRSLVRAAAGVGDLAVEVERSGAFSFVAELADGFRAGNVFLAGDAAHRVTPRGGTGMNTAIASAHDLGWKLGWVRRGWATDRLLDTYESERRPIVEHNIARSIDPTGSRRSAADEIPVDLGGRLPHVWQSHDRARVSTLDLLTEGLTLLTAAARAWSGAAANARTRVPITVRSVDAPGALGLGIGSRGAVLVRPDGRPVASTSRADDPAVWLARACGDALGGSAGAVPEAAILGVAVPTSA